MTKARKPRNKIVRASRGSNAEPLPGRTPSKAFTTALDAVGKMKGKKKL